MTDDDDDWHFVFGWILCYGFTWCCGMPCCGCWTLSTLPYITLFAYSTLLVYGAIWSTAWNGVEDLFTKGILFFVICLNLGSSSCAVSVRRMVNTLFRQTLSQKFAESN